MEFGLMTFADMDPESQPGSGVNGHRRITELMEEIKLAEQLDLDVFGVGEHHRSDYAVSTPAVILAAAAMITKKIKLTSTVTVLSSDDPVRVFQEFATVDLLSEGRVEIMAGRGAFIESFPLFGYQLKDYEELFAEKLDLLLTLNNNDIVSWKGKHRPSIDNKGIYPRPYQNTIPIWLAAGGTTASAVRAATLGLPLMLAIIGGNPEQFVPFINLYKETAKKVGKEPQSLQIGINNHLFIGEDSQKAGNEFFSYYATMIDRVGRDRGWGQLTRNKFEHSRSSKGALMVGSVQQVVDKILYEHELFGNTRFLAQASLGNTPHKMNMKSIELFGNKVVPAVKKEINS